MKKIPLIILCVLVFEAPFSLAREQLANENKEGIYAKSIERVLRLEPEEIDLGTAALIVSEKWSDLVHGRRLRQRLNDMAYDVLERLERKNLRVNNYKTIEVINEYLFDELGFTAISEATEPGDLFLHTVLEKKRGYCLSLSILYLALGERLGLPLYGVVVPKHFFVRYDNGKVRFNIETTSKGGYANDEHYLEKFNVPIDNNDSIYMINLDKRQTLGCFFNNLGNSYSLVGNIEQAQVALERAVQINPSLAESRINLGNIYMRKNLLAEAIQQYQAAIYINPNDAIAHNNLGNAYSRKGWLNDAIGEYTQSLRLDPDATDTYKNLAGVYIKQGLAHKAITELKQALFLKPNDPEAYCQLGDAYGKMEDYNKAISYYEEALEIKPNFADAHYGLAICYNSLGQTKNEIRAYKKALAIKPDMTAALTNLGNAYFTQGKYDDAVEQYSKAIVFSPDDAAIYYNLGAAHSNNSDHKKAVAAYKKAVELDPNMADAHNGLAFTYYKLKDYKPAWQHIKTAQQLGAEISKDLLKAIEKKVR
ncbi:MAG: tetratricopeptide repeat protein [Planctomycetota bacterium]|jgi:tetratricopeptide (TPR) repeat protein